MKTTAIVSALVVVCAGLVAAQRGQGPGGQAPNPNRAYLKVDGAVVAITHVRVIDGTGAPTRADQTLILRDGNIAAMGPAISTSVPDGATVVDGTGKSVMPGLVMLHEHLYYPTGPGVARGSRGRDRSGAQARAEGHGASLLGDTRRSGGPRH